MLNKIIKILLISLFFLLPLINSHLFDLLGIKWGFYVSGNYEFTKVIFFNILSGIILTLFFINSFLNKNKLIIPKIILPIILILFLSTIFSKFGYTSLFGNTSKGHSLLMFLNLIGLFVIFINQDIKINKKLIIISIISSILVGIIGIKEYSFPTFDYGNLSNRAISTFGHPNYLALFILILIPFLIEKFNNYFDGKYNKGLKLSIDNFGKYFFIFITFLLIFLLFLTKSTWGILILLSYIGFTIYSKNTEKIQKKYINIFIIISIIILGLIVYKFGLLTKLNSFLSRFYIWETTINIIISDIKNIIFGSGLGTLDLIFDKFKAPELYIFENIGFTADRPHNLFLNLFYYFGMFGLGILIFLIVKLIKNIKNNPYYHSLILFLIFTIFNFGGISHYLIIILIISIVYNYSNNLIQKKYLKNFTIFTILFSGILGIMFSCNYYINEHKRYLDNSYITKNILIKKIELQSKKSKILSVNDYFYFGNLYRDSNKKEAIEYYNSGLKLLPDMWNENSKYYDNYFIKKLFISERFYSEKFSNLKEILNKLGIK